MFFDSDKYLPTFDDGFKDHIYAAEIIKKLKFKLAYSVDYRNITIKDLKNKPYKLPRFYCNLF